MRRIAGVSLLAASLLATPARAHAAAADADSSAADSTRRGLGHTAAEPRADSLAGAPQPDSARTGVPARWQLHEIAALTGDDARPLVEPSGVLSDAFGRVWVSDASLHKLRRWRPDGTPLDETGALGSEPTQFRRPGALARVGSLGVAVLDVENRRVSTYDHHLRLIGAAVELASQELEARIGLVRPVAVASDRGGALYVADAERDRVLVFDYSGAFQRELGGYGGRSGGFAGLAGIATGARGTLYTVERPRPAPRRAAATDSSQARSRVQWLDAGGRVLGSWWTPPWAAGPAEVSLSVAVDGAGRLAVVAERSGELRVFSPDGNLLASAGGLAGPRAVAFADDGTLLVAEAGAGRVRRWTLEPAGAR